MTSFHTCTMLPFVKLKLSSLTTFGQLYIFDEQTFFETMALLFLDMVSYIWSEVVLHQRRSLRAE